MKYLNIHKHIDSVFILYKLLKESMKVDHSKLLTVANKAWMRDTTSNIIRQIFGTDSTIHYVG